MAAVAALLEGRRAVQGLRRGMGRNGTTLVSCRSPAALEKLLGARLVDAIVLDPRGRFAESAADLRRRFPEIPLIAFAAFRPDDGELVQSCHRSGMAALLVEGVDEPVAGELIARCSASAQRRRALADAPRVLRLSEPLQRAVWEDLLDRVTHPVRTAAIAKRLRVSREHLSRQFGAGAAPNLKRVIDLTRIACAAQLLRNPAYSVPSVVRLLHFASPSHLGSTARRIAGVPAGGLAALGPRGVLAAFAKWNMRSRL